MVNCLLDDSLAGVGLGTPTTHTLNYYKNSHNPSILCRDISGKCLCNTEWNDIERGWTIPQSTVRVMYGLPDSFDLHQNIFIDTPGLDASGKDAAWDTMITADIVRDNSVDLLILVISNTQLDDTLKNTVLPLIKDSKKKLIVLMNCNQKGRSPDPAFSGNEKIARQIDEELRFAGVIPCRITRLSKTRVLPCNVVWWWMSQSGKKKQFFLNEQTSHVFMERYQEVKNYYSIILSQTMPDFETLQHKSNISHVFSYLRNPDMREMLWDEDNPRLTSEQLKHQLKTNISRGMAKYK